MSERTSKKGSYQDFVDGKLENKVFVFTLVRKNEKPSIIKSTGKATVYPASSRLEAYSKITEKDPKTGLPRTREIRYVPGQRSIYVDEQAKDLVGKTKKYMIEFIHGEKLVNASAEPELLQFMMKCNANKTNPARQKTTPELFELVDSAKLIQSSMEDDKMRHKANDFCYTGDWDEVEAYARVLGIPMEQSSDEIRYNLRQIANRDPYKFLNGMKDPLMKKKYYVMAAIEGGFLINNSSNNTICWATNPSQPIVVAPMGMSVIDTLAQKLATEEGRPAFEAIVDFVAPPLVVEAKIFVPKREEMEKAVPTPVVEAPIASDPDEWTADESIDELIELAEKAVALGVAEKNGPAWLKIDGVSFMKAKGLAEKMGKNAMLLKVVKFRVNKKENEANAPA